MVEARGISSGARGENMTEIVRGDRPDAPKTEKQIDEEEAKPTLSPVLARLVEEVRNEEEKSPHAYSRMHNRHNRSR